MNGLRPAAISYVPVAQVQQELAQERDRVRQLEARVLDLQAECDRLSHVAQQALRQPLRRRQPPPFPILNGGRRTIAQMLFGY